MDETETGYRSAVGPDVFAPATLGPVRLRNRVVKAATFVLPSAWLFARLTKYR